MRDAVYEAKTKNSANNYKDQPTVLTSNASLKYKVLKDTDAEKKQQ